MDTIADIDIDVPHISRDLCMHIHHLICLKLTSKAEQMGDISALYDSDRDCWRRRRLIPGIRFSTSRKKKGSSAQGKQGPQ